MFHPDLPAGVRVAGSFPMEQLPVWGNHVTVSPEPYHRPSVPPGESDTWSMTCEQQATAHLTGWNAHNRCLWLCSDDFGGKDGGKL